MKQVNVLLDHDPRWGLRTKEVKQLAAQILVEDSRVEDKTEVSILFCTKKRAQKLNIDFRKMDYIPQVLGFPLEEMRDKDGWIRLGDIVVCSALLAEEARLWNRKQMDILKEWLIHGLNNLFKPTAGTVDTLH